MKRTKLISVLCAATMLLSSGAAVSAATGAETPALEEHFGLVAATEMNGYNGWSYDNVYTTAIDDNSFTIVQESDVNTNLVASIKKTGTDSSVTDKTRKWITKDIALGSDTTKVTVQFRIKSTKAASSEIFDVGFRAADGTWHPNGIFRLLTGTTGNNFGALRADGSQYDYYNKLNATAGTWNTVRIVFDQTADSVAATVNGAAAGGFKLSSATKIGGRLPTAVGFGWNRAIANAEVMLDDIVVLRDGVSGYQSDSFDLATAGDSLTGYLDWSAANTYSDGTAQNNVYTIKDDTTTAGNKVANFYKGPTTGGSRLWAAHPLNVPTDAEKIVVSFKLRTNAATGLFDVGLANGSTWGANGHFRFDFDNNTTIWRPGLGGSWTSNANLDLTGAWNDIQITIQPGHKQNDNVRGLVAVEVNGKAAGSDFMNSTGLQQVFTPTAIGLGWFRAQAAGANIDIDDFAVSVPGLEAQSAGFTESFALPSAGSQLVGFNGWSAVNEYTYPKKDDNVATLVPEEEGSNNIVANFEKTMTDADVTDKNRKWFGKTFTLADDVTRVSAQFKLRRLGDNTGRFDVGFLGDNSWGTGNGFVNFTLTEDASYVSFVDNSWVSAPALNDEAGQWHNIEILLDYNESLVKVYAEGALLASHSLTMTNSHLASAKPSGIAFGFARSAAGTQAQVDDVVVGKAADLYPTTVTDITVENNKLSSITLTNTTALTNAVAYAAVYAKSNGALTDVIAMPIEGSAAAVGSGIVLTPSRDVAVAEGAVVKAFVWNSTTLRPYSLSKTRAKTAAIDYDSLTLAQDGDMSKNFTIHVIGDSTAASYGSNVYPLTGWAQVLGDYFTDNVTVNDDAISGESSKTFYEIPPHWQATISEVQAGDYVMIQFGHNDEKQSGTSEVDTSQTLYTSANGTYKEYLGKFIDESIAKGATPILVTSINRRAFDDKGNLSTSSTNLMTYVAAMKELAAEKNVTVLDVNAKTKLLYEYYGEKGSNALFMNLAAGEYDNWPNGRTDNTHLREAGAREVAKLVGVALAESNHTLAGYLKH